MPKFSLQGEGTAHFDPEAGIIVRKEQRFTWTKTWTGKLDPELVRRNPNWDVDVDEVTTCSITVGLISDEEASRLIKQAEVSESKRVTPQKEAPLTPKWIYYVERSAVHKDKLRKEERILVDHVLVKYGAGKPQVVYVDEQKRPLERQHSAGQRFQPFPVDKLPRAGRLPTFGGPGSGMGWPVGIVANCFDILPMIPESGLSADEGWEREIEMCFNAAPRTNVMATIKHNTRGYEEIRGRRCLKIDYTVSGAFKAADHPELFSAEELKEREVEYVLSGNGTAYIDAQTGILVDKEQTLTWSSLYRRLRKLDDRRLGWVSEVDKEESVKVSVSLQGAEQSR